LEKVTLPEGVVSIGDYGFMGNISSFSLPASLETIGEHAFFSESKKVTVSCPEGSIAERHVKKNYPDYTIKRRK